MVTASVKSAVGSNEAQAHIGKIIHILTPPLFNLAAFICLFLPIFSVPISHDFYFFGWEYRDSESRIIDGYRWGLWGGCKTGNENSTQTLCTQTAWGYELGLVNTSTNKETSLVPYDKSKALGVLLPLTASIAFIGTVISSIISYKLYKYVRKANSTDTATTTANNNTGNNNNDNSNGDEENRQKVVPRSLSMLSNFCLGTVGVALVMTATSFGICWLAFGRAKNRVEHTGDNYLTQYGSCMAMVEISIVILIATFVFEFVRYFFYVSPLLNKATFDISSRFSMVKNNQSNIHAISLRKFDTSWGVGTGKWNELHDDDDQGKK